ncbi:MAG: hypothetical protein EOO56_10485 [Hymenobacter sp.]|nr:MAG: hypothetical protein EOO56_10485 [Hymenobacter sp.]
MKSFIKISSLFALIIIGRYLQPAAIASIAAARPAPTVQVLPLALARYTSTPLLQAQPHPGHAKAIQMQQPTQGYYFL